MGYDAANNTVRKEIHVPNLLGIASTSLAKFFFFQAAMLKKVHGLVVVAGTNAVAAFDVYVGTASVGSVAFGTNTAGVVVHSGAINVAIPANGYVELKGAATSATLTAALSIEYQTTPDAVQS